MYLAARRHDAGPQRARRPGAQAPRPCQPAERHRQRMADARARPRPSARRSTSRRDIRYPVLGAALQRRGGTARHDAVAWGYARGADARGVDIIQNCEVTGIRRGAGRRASTGVETTRGSIRDQEGRRRRGRPYQRDHGDGGRAHAARELSAAGAGLGAGQAGASRAWSCRTRCTPTSRQSDKGELVIGAGTDAYVSYSQTGGLHIVDAHARCDLRAVPDVLAHAHAAQLGRHRRRDAGPLADHRQDAGARASTSIAAGAPAASRRRRARATSSPHTIAKDEPHPIDAPFTLDRFRTGRLIDEAAAAAVAH